MKSNLKRGLAAVLLLGSSVAAYASASCCGDLICCLQQLACCLQ